MKITDTVRVALCSGALVMSGSAAEKLLPSGASLLLPAGGALPVSKADRRDVISEDVSRFTALLRSPAPERRIEGAQGLSNLKHWPAENALLGLLDDASSVVRREAAFALGRLGGAQTIPRLIALLDDPSWEIRQNAWLDLRTMSAQDFESGDRRAWEKWWTDSSLAEKKRALLAVAGKPPETMIGSGANAAVSAGFVSSEPGRRVRVRTSTSPPVHPARRDALRALVRFATQRWNPWAKSAARSRRGSWRAH